MLFVAFAGMAANFPFPTAATYAGGIKATLKQSTLQTRYESWVKNHYEESGNLARIKFDTPNTDKTVSEGIGYGMLIFVQMDNETNKTQDEFNKLWAYYNRYLNGNGVMHWKIKKFDDPNTGGVDSKNGATDAELDVALALVLAHYQWGSTGTVNYIKAAEDLIDIIYQKEVNKSTFLLKPGDAWDDVKNPCYFSMATLKAFDEVQTKEAFTKKNDWAKVIEKSYVFMQLAQNDKTGLYPDWCNEQGNQVGGYGYDFSYDACRTPWRIVWDYVWWGNQTAKTMSALTCEWAKNIAPADVKSGYTVTGTANGAYNNSCFIGGLGAAFMCDSKYQSQLDSYYTGLLNKEGEYYYSATIQIIYALLMSGNTYNPLAGKSAARIGMAATSADGKSIILTSSKALASVAAGDLSKFSATLNGAATTLTTIALSADKKQITLGLTATLKTTDKLTVSYNGTSIMDGDNFALATFSNLEVANNVFSSSTVIIDFKNGATTILGTPWYSFNDAGPGGKSVITPLSTDKKAFACTKPGYGGTDSAAYASYTLNDNGGALGYNPFVGMGFAMSKPEAAYDLSGSTGISFMYKGSAATLEINLSTITNDQNFAAAIPASADWTPIELKWGAFAQGDWGTNGKIVPWDASKVVKFQWKAQAKTGTSGTMSVDNVTLNNITIKPGSTLKTTALSTAIASAESTLATAAEGTAVGQYPSGSKAILSTAISNAKTALSNATTQTEIDQAVVTLNKAVSDFVTKANKPNIAELTSKITEAQTLYNGATEGLVAGNYKTGSKATLNTAITTATSAKTAATQGAVDLAVTELQKAIDAFKLQIVKMDYTQLQLAATGAQTLHNDATEGTATGQYKSGAKATYQTAINTAKAALTATTQAAIDAAIVELAKATATFNNQKIGPDYTALNAEMEKAALRLQSATEGTAAGQYASGAKASLQAAIAEARKASSATSQTTINDAKAALTKAIAEFDSKKIALNTAVLATAIKTAQDQHNGATEGTAVGNYKAGSKAAYQTAINTASTALTASTTQAQIDAAIAALNKATGTFYGSKITKTPIVEIGGATIRSYPNPAVKQITIESSMPMESVTLITMLGKVLHKVDAQASEATVDVENLPKGSYIALIRFENGNYGTKVFLKK